MIVTLIVQLSLGHSHTRRARPGVRIGRKSLICTNYKREHARPAFNSSCIPTVLASYPGSGSTITRLLIEMTTGVWTGSIYGDESLYTSMPHPFCGEMTTQDVVAIKSHGPWEGQPTVEFAKRAVLMLRSPFTAIPSYYNWFNTFHKKGSKALQHQKQAPEEDWIQWRGGGNVRNQTEYWTNHFSYWVERFNHTGQIIFRIGLNDSIGLIHCSLPNLMIWLMKKVALAYYQTLRDSLISLLNTTERKRYGTIPSTTALPRFVEIRVTSQLIQNIKSTSLLPS